MLWVAMCVVFLPVVSHGQEVEDESAQVIREVKADPVFKVHTVTEKVAVPKSRDFSWSLPSWLGFAGAGWLGQVIVYSALGLLIGLIVWLIWKNRHAPMFRGLGGREALAPGATRVVMGMDVSPETLPADVPTAAWELWLRGRHHEALGLLYRGAISRAIELGRVEILESDTEGDCVRRVDAVGPAAHPDFFRDITKVWIGLAYAGRRPEDRDVEALCRQWPFSERRTG